MGLRLFVCHRLASSLLLPIFGYAGDIFTPTVDMLRKLSGFCHKVQRWCTNSFTCTLSDILAIEACLRRHELLMTYKRCLAHLRLLCSHQAINPTTARLAPSVQTIFRHSHGPDHRVLLGKGYLWPCPPTLAIA